MKIVPDQHLFTVRGRPVMFRKEEDFFGALHATERGWCPIHHTGYYGITQFTSDAVERTGFFDLLSGNFLESIATEKERKTNEVLRDIVQCSRTDAAAQSALIHCLECASRAFEHGLFATDAQRRQLWQAAHETYANLFDYDSAWLVAGETRGFLRYIKYERQIFDALCQCMRGEFSHDQARSHPYAFHL